MAATIIDMKKAHYRHKKCKTYYQHYRPLPNSAKCELPACAEQRCCECKECDILSKSGNLDIETVEGFGDEWTRFDQSIVPAAERQDLFDSYFRIFPWEALPENAVGFDAGCGSGRWAMLVAPRVGHLHCADPSSAIDVATRNLKSLDNRSA